MSVSMYFSLFEMQTSAEISGNVRNIGDVNHFKKIFRYEIQNYD